MFLDAVKYDRADFYSYVADMEYSYPCPIIHPDSSDGIPISDYCDFSYLGQFNVDVLFSDMILSVAPYSFFTHLHLARILYGRIKIFEQSGDLVLRLGSCDEELVIKVRDLIQSAPLRIFDKKIYAEYFDKFSIDRERFDADDSREADK